MARKPTRDEAIPVFGAMRAGMTMQEKAGLQRKVTIKLPTSLAELQEKLPELDAQDVVRTPLAGSSDNSTG